MARTSFSLLALPVTKRIVRGEVVIVVLLVIVDGWEEGGGSGRVEIAKSSRVESSRGERGLMGQQKTDPASAGGAHISASIRPLVRHVWVR